MALLIAGDVAQVFVIGRRIASGSEVALGELVESVVVELVLKVFELDRLAINNLSVMRTIR